MPAVATYGGGKAEDRGMNKVMRIPCDHWK
jgi:hypothetical protein